jgi:hypothetical protein
MTQDQHTDTFDKPTEIDWDDPSEILMAKEEAQTDKDNYREASRHFLRIISLAFSFALEARNPEVALWAVSYSLGLPNCDCSMREKSRQLGISSGTLSIIAKRFNRISGLGPSLNQHPKKSKSKKNGK